MVTKLIRAGTRMSIAEFLDLPDTEEKQKMELDDGELYIMPPTPNCSPIPGVIPILARRQLHQQFCGAARGSLP